MQPAPVQNELLVSLSDLLLLVKKAKKKILFFTAIGAGLGMLYALISPLSYTVVGSFRDASKNSGPSLPVINELIQNMVGISGGSDNNAIVFMHSRKLMDPLVREMNLQATISEKRPLQIFNRLSRNFQIEYAWLKYGRFVRPRGGLASKVVVTDQVIVPDQSIGIACSQVSYEAETFLPLTVELLSEDSYQLLDSKGEIRGSGSFGALLETPDFSLRLVRLSQEALVEKKYNLTLLPMQAASSSLIHKIAIKREKENKNIIAITYSDPDRHLAAAIVNRVMLGYQEYLKQEHELVAKEQLGYLERRQEETSSKLEQLMESHASYLKDHLDNGGFIELDKEVEFVASQQDQLKARLLAIEIDLRTLANVNREEYFYSRKPGDLTLNDSIFTELRDLRQQRDVLNIALKRMNVESPDSLKDALLEHLKQLHETDEDLKDTSVLLEALVSGKEPPVNLKLLQKEGSLVPVWLSQIKEFHKQHSDESSEKEAVQERENFIAYLQNFQRLLTVQSRLLQERVIRHSGSEKEFQGINLETSRELYLGYNNKLDGMKANIDHLAYLLQKMTTSEFDISSLSTVLQDPISEKLIHETADLLLMERDIQNHSAKEKDRIRAQLSRSRNFLLSHLVQKKEVLSVQETLYLDKIHALQKMTLDLIHQKISLLEEQLDEHVNTKDKMLNLEKGLLKHELTNLSQSMSHLPEKWLSEKRLQMRTEVNMEVIGELAALVEGKIIGSNLERIEAAPLDIAIPPALPNSPKILFFTILGALSWGFFSIGFYIMQGVRKGIAVSSSALRALGQFVCGNLPRNSSFADIEGNEDALKVLRQAAAFLLSSSKDSPVAEGGKVALIVLGEGVDYSVQLAQLLIRRSEKVLIVDGNFSKQCEYSAGLLQFLEGKVEAPAFEMRGGVPFLPTGGETAYGVDLLASKRFQSYLDQLRQTYDWILLTLPYTPCSAEAQNLLYLGDRVLATLSDEKASDVYSQPEFTKRELQPKVGFLLS